MSDVIEQTSLARLYAVYGELPEFSNREPLQALSERVGEDYLALVCSDDGRDLGFKLGYAESEHSFYSWLGGVLPEARGRGLAQQLLETQEAWVRQRGFRQIRVKSMNRFPAMLRLLLRNGYLIEGLTQAQDPLRNKIHFVKPL